MIKPPPLDLVPPAHVAAILGVHVMSVYRWVHRGQLTRYGTPRAYRLSLAEALRKAPAIQQQNRARKGCW